MKTAANKKKLDDKDDNIPAVPKKKSYLRRIIHVLWKNKKTVNSPRWETKESKKIEFNGNISMTLDELKNELVNNFKADVFNEDYFENALIRIATVDDRIITAFVNNEGEPVDFWEYSRTLRNARHQLNLHLLTTQIKNTAMLNENSESAKEKNLRINSSCEFTEPDTSKNQNSSVISKSSNTNMISKDQPSILGPLSPKTNVCSLNSQNGVQSNSSKKSNKSSQKLVIFPSCKGLTQKEPEKLTQEKENFGNDNVAVMSNDTIISADKKCTNENQVVNQTSHDFKIPANPKIHTSYIRYES